MKRILTTIFFAAAWSGTAPAQSNASFFAGTNASMSSNTMPGRPAVTLVLPTNSPAAGTNGLAAATTAHGTNVLEIDDSNETAKFTVTNALRLNFQDVPLNSLLHYLSARMGFVIVSEVDVRGNATLMSEQPVNTNEVLTLLSGALAKNNYSVTRNGRVLTIVAADTAKNSSQTPVKQATTPDQIPNTDEIATYVLPVHTLNPTQLIKDLEPLVPTSATLAANEAGNALIMTARQKDIRRFDQILAALDSSSVSDVAVFILRYADAKSVASELKEIFQSPDSTVAKSDSRQRFRGGGFGGGGFPGFGGGDPAGGSGSEKNAANKAVFVSDDQMNAVVASAPADFFPSITNIIDRLDHASEDVTIMKVFHLKYADPQETADELSNLFPDETKTSDQNNRSMGFRFTPPWMQQPAATSTKSDRMTRQTSVRAVPDPRTASLIVTTSKELMEQIAGVIEEMDRNQAGTKHVYSYDLSTADPVTVQAALTAMFSGGNTKASTQSTQNASALASRVQNNAQSQTSSSSSSGFGSAAGGSSSLH